jgi:hypothetical protein
VQQSEYAPMQLEPGSYQTVYDPTMGYLDVVFPPPQGQGQAQAGPGPSTSAQAEGEYQGPFLTTHLPLSPVEAWSVAVHLANRPTLFGPPKTIVQYPLPRQLPRTSLSAAACLLGPT